MHHLSTIRWAVIAVVFFAANLAHAGSTGVVY